MIQSPNISFLGQQINWASQQAQGLVTAWPLNDGGGLIARSCCGRYDGTLVNSPTWTQGKFGNALSIDGTNRYVNVGSALTFADKITISFWLKAGTQPADGDSNGLVVRDNLSTLRSFALQHSTTNKIGWYIKTTAVTSTLLSDATMVDSVWHHIACLYDGAQLRMYIDGKVQASTVNTTGNLASGGDILIGSYNTATRGENGSFSDVRLYNRALSAKEVQDIYVNPLGLYVPRKKILSSALSTASALYTRMLTGIGL